MSVEVLVWAGEHRKAVDLVRDMALSAYTHDRDLSAADVLYFLASRGEVPPFSVGELLEALAAGL